MSESTCEKLRQQRLCEGAGFSITYLGPGQPPHEDAWWEYTQLFPDEDLARKTLNSLVDAGMRCIRVEKR
jgi:hypothetical protein